VTIIEQPYLLYSHDVVILSLLYSLSIVFNQ